MYINSSKDINKAALGLIRAAADRALKTDDANAQLDAVSYASGVQDCMRVLGCKSPKTARKHLPLAKGRITKVALARALS